ncbi:SH3 domain-containing protein [Tropicibacter sp. R15_0]|uniref:SH3 domain-containing protein n=1 Tax=Tropicibacter sp. R15_0 TaxID=2821101 RepID=UPI001ADB52DB|nr:SH3 domain-containing protein [Tropicibacter sp. R15_0]MBO9468106.1 SH3 domain-containing protein [Tropicibacter sp. R15_0]
MFRILACLMALFIATSAAATEGRQVYINAPKDGFLNLREGPSTRYPVMEKMRHGDNVTFLAQPGEWVKVYHHQSDSIGWAHGHFISDTKPRDRHTNPIYEPRKFRWVDAPYGDLNLRKGPGTNYHVVRKMHNGTKVEILGRSGKWRLLKLNSGLIGWAHKAYLSKERPHTPKPQPNPRPYSDLQAAYDACEHHRGRDFRFCIMQRLPGNR